jgi:hypothetical protein
VCRYPGPAVGYLDHQAVGSVDLGSHHDPTVVAPSERIQDSVADRLRGSELDVIAIRSSGVRILGSE